MSLIKEKMSQYKIDEEIKLLTLVLELETITHTVTKFPSTTQSMVLQCRKLMKKKGLILMPLSGSEKNHLRKQLCWLNIVHRRYLSPSFFEKYLITTSQ